MSNSPEWISWSKMKDRCYNKKSDRYPYYGGRGIKVCKAWRESFEKFYNDMGPRHTGTSLDRINNSGNYDPKNCRWATKSEQALNRRVKSTHSTGIRYVTVWKNKFKAQPIINGKSKYIGLFKTINEAKKAIKEFYVKATNTK